MTIDLNLDFEFNTSADVDQLPHKINFGPYQHEVENILIGYHFNKDNLVFWDYVLNELNKRSVPIPDAYRKCGLEEFLFWTVYLTWYGDLKSASLFYENLDLLRFNEKHKLNKKCLSEMVYLLGSGIVNKVLINCGARQQKLYTPLTKQQTKLLNETISKLNEKERINSMDIKEKEYDSYADTMIHKRNIEDVMLPLIEALQERMKNHDNSKLTYPEKEGYDKHIPELKKHKYGSPEYVKAREAMAKDCLDHHWEVNRHHPEHFPRMLKDMNLVDFFEYFCDCYASSLVSDTGFDKGVEINAKKHELPDTMVEIFKNTVRDFF